MMNAPATEAPVTTKAAIGSVSYDSTMTDFAAEEAKNTVDLSSPSSTPKKARKKSANTLPSSTKTKTKNPQKQTQKKCPKN